MSNHTKKYFSYMFSFSGRKQENYDTIFGQFRDVHHQYTTSRHKNIWHLENISNTKTRDENSLREYFDRKSKPTQKYSFILFTRNAANILYE